MDGSPGRKGSSGWRAATPLVAVGRIGLRDPQQKHAVVKAIEGAARRLARTECQGLLDEFADASGRPLRAVLEDMDASAPEYLGWVLFHDADPGTCPGPTLVHNDRGRPGRPCVRPEVRARRLSEREPCRGRDHPRDAPFAGPRREPSVQPPHHAAGPQPVWVVTECARTSICPNPLI
jgi:hypothetical protein